MSDTDDKLAAQELFRRVATLKPDTGSFKGWLIKGRALTKLGKFDEALKAFEKAIEIDPKYALAWNNKGNCSH